jgi:predicted ferric reductase
MVSRGRSSDGPHPDNRYPDGQYPNGQYPDGQYPDGRPYPPVWPTGAQLPVGPGPSRPTGAWPASQAAAVVTSSPRGRGETGGWQASPAAQAPAQQLPPPEWADRPMGHRWTTSWRVRQTAAQPVLPPERPAPATRRQTGGWPADRGGPESTEQLPPWELSAGQRTTGSQRATGSQAAAGAVRTTGGMRTVRPMAPGTGQARIVLPVVVLAVIGLGLVGVAYLWWRSTLFMHTPGALLTNIGEILGLAAGYGFVILVALMARLPPLERGIGTDRLARWHATGGRYLITTVSGHVVFIILGYSVTARTSVVSETATLLTTFPDVLMAAVAWFLLLGVAAFSMRAARRRINYETWYYAHLYTYLAIALAFSHQFAAGGTFAESFQARVAWSALYAVVGGLLLWYRVITPLRSAARHRFTVQAVRPEAPGIVSVFISGRDFDRLRAEPGQFFRWRFLTKELWWQSHPYSLSAMPQPDLMRITVKSSGDHSGSLARLRPGTRIIAEGPYGAFTPSLTGRRVLFIAGGVGITPIRAMFAALPKRMSGGITLLYRASHPRDVVFSRELNAIANDRQAALHYLVGSRADLGFDPLDARHLQHTVPGLHRYEAYVCGPSGMTEAAVRSLVAAGIPRRRIHHESFDF